MAGIMLLPCCSPNGMLNIFRQRLQAIQRLDAQRDHQRIVQWDVCYEFPFDTTRALEFALFRTYCVPRISGLLDRTCEFAKQPQKRYDDTDLIVSELLEWGYDSERGAQALARMNRIHGHFHIANADFLYVLSTFVFEPIRWNARFGWRAMGEQEKLALFYFWRAVGERMGIKDIPADYALLEYFNLEYERQHFVFCESNRRIGDATCDLFASWFPRPLQPVVRRVIYALLDEPVRLAFGFPKAPRGVRSVVIGALKLRAFVLQFWPARRKPRLRTMMQHSSYPRGYSLEQTGPSYMHAIKDEQNHV